jgi:hypothetical protein
VKLSRAHAAAVIAGAAALVGLAARREAPAPGPVLVVRVLVADAGDAGAVREATGSEARAMAIAGVSMSPADRARILEQLDYTTARLEARLSPLDTDFGDDDPVDELRRSLERHMPTFTAARELERGAWRSADLAVRLAASCADGKPAADETCVSLWNDREGDGPPALGRRARFLAWAASRAVVADLGTRERVAECARKLRERTSANASTVALVLTNDDLTLLATPDRAALHEAARRLGAAMAANGRRDTKDLEAFANAIPEDRAAPWLALPATALVVVPRLSAIADTDGFRKEIEAVAGAQVRWIHGP